MLEKLPGTQPVTVGGDQGFDTRDFVKECRNLRGGRMWRRTMRDRVAARVIAAPRSMRAMR